MAEIVLDANVIVALLYADDSQHQRGEVRFLAHECERLAGSVLDIVTETAGSLNANDALSVALQRERVIDTLATFDRGFEIVTDFSLTSCALLVVLGASISTPNLSRRTSELRFSQA
jgi:predicted nucleic acid-binding protein